MIPDAAAPRRSVSLSRLSDLASRALLGLWFGYYGSRNLVTLLNSIDPAGFSLERAVVVLPGLAKNAFAVALAIAVVTRLPRVAKLGGVYPRLVAFLGTFFAPLVLLSALAPRADPPPLLAEAASVLVLLGGLGSLAVLAWLGRSFSLMPEARRLVVTGPYRWVRHPLYLTEELLMVGLFLTYPWGWTILFTTVHVALQLERMRLEERVLRRAFPDYAGYASRTARLVPGLY